VEVITALPLSLRKPILQGLGKLGWPCVGHTALLRETLLHLSDPTSRHWTPRAAQAGLQVASIRLNSPELASAHKL